MPEDQNKTPVGSPSVHYGEQDENGVDLSLIRRNLRLTPAERLRRAEKQSKGLQHLREHVRRNREKRS